MKKAHDDVGFFLAQKAMTQTTKAEKLAQMLAPAVAACGVQLWGVEFFPQGRRSVLRVYIDSPEGVTVDMCGVVSHQVSGVLDVEDPIAGEYVLEVSSPGWDRPLYTQEQYRRYVGSQVHLRLCVPVQGRRRYTGLLQSVDETGKLRLLVDGNEVELALSQIDKGHVVAD